MNRFGFQRECVRAALNDMPDGADYVLNVGCCLDGVIKPLDPARIINCDISAVDEHYDDPDDLTRVTSTEPTAADAIFDAARDRWPFADGQAGLVVLGDILEHMSPEDIVAALTEARRVGHRLCVTAPEDTRELNNDEWADQYRRGKVHRTVVTESLLRDALERSGWRIVRWIAQPDYDQSSVYWGKRIAGFYVEAE